MIKIKINKTSIISIIRSIICSNVVFPNLLTRWTCKEIVFESLIEWISSTNRHRSRTTDHYIVLQVKHFVSSTKNIHFYIHISQIDFKFNLHRIDNFLRIISS